MSIPVVDLSSPVAIGEACRTHGFFYVTDHGVPVDLQERLEHQSREFFAQDVAVKLQIRMELAGAAWRGYFPVGDELTSGEPDRKEGLYFGVESPPGRPLHGPNLFPRHPAGFRDTVLEYMAAMTELGHKLMAAIAMSLQLEANYFAARYTTDPFTLFRIFNYPPGDGTSWGVGEHTDYGLLTILNQDTSGGLQVKSQDEWIDAVPIPGTFVCNIGDMLDRLTGGRYRSTPHRVTGTRSADRLSWPFFFDPNFDADIRAIGDRVLADDHNTRWDQASVHEFQGTYGEYLMAKVAKVFPHLG